MVGEQQYLYDDLSAWEYLLFFGTLYRVEGAEQRVASKEDLDQLSARWERAKGLGGENQGGSGTAGRPETLRR